MLLSGFRPVSLRPRAPQAGVLAYTARMMARARCARDQVTEPAVRARALETAQRRVARYGVSAQDIGWRELNILPPDLDASDPPALFAGLDDDPFGDRLDARLAAFRGLAARALDAAFPAAEAAPDDLVHVTCSGYLSPSPAQELASRRGWHGTTVTHCYHMGCYGAFPALRLARGFLAAEPGRRVEVVHTEALSLHVSVVDQSPANIINSTLFADGFIRYTARAGAGAGLEVRAVEERILPDSTADMTWTPGPHRFEMTLSKEVPGRIRAGIAAFVADLCDRAGFAFERDKGRLHYAVHPGGPRILDAVRDALGLDEAHLALSRRTLHACGNMSSATCPTMWAELARTAPAGARILTLAFGPGLSAAGAVLVRSQDNPHRVWG